MNEAGNPLATEDAPTYRITIKGQIAPQWAAWLNGDAVPGIEIAMESEQPPVTTLTMPVIDQAKLRGILNKLWDLNLTLIAVRRVDKGGHYGNNNHTITDYPDAG